MIVDFEDEAQEEIEKAIVYSDAQFGIGEKLSRTIQSAGLSITDNPFRFRKNHLGICILRLPPFPFYLVFAPDQETRTIRFFAFGNTSRRLNYWKSRI